MTVGQRLREERETLGLSQPKFAALAGTTKQTLFSWESDKTAPTAGQLAALSAAGVDATYVLTGIRSPHPDSSLTPQEKDLVECFRQLKPEQQGFIRQTVSALVAANKEKSK